MSKRFLGLICLLYSAVFSYVILFDKLKNFLAPQMQIYIKLSVIPLLIIGLVMLFNDNIHYKFKITDLVLLLPLILIISAGDGRLTTTIVNNRTTNKIIQSEKKEEKTNKEEKIDNEDKEIEIPKQDENATYDLSNPYFDIIDENYNDISAYITYSPKAEKFNGKTIRVRGLATKKSENLTDEYFLIGKYSISCCAADAGFASFITKYDINQIEENKWYEVEGVLEKGKMKDGYDAMYIKAINIKEIDSNTEEQYVYPCYSYGDGKCEAMGKYDFS